jgi:Na+/H+ antiporter NhaD/arsenite permease-like protein
MSLDSLQGIEWTSGIIFGLTYLGIIFTRLPRVNVDRPSAAFSGAVAMVLFGVLSLPEAVAAIDYHTIALLLGMMIVVASLQIDGFFSWIAHKTISYAHTRSRLLCLVVVVTGVASAFLVNDAVVLLFTPVLIALCRSAGLNPVPYLIAEILSANAGSVMTITGNPQNMIIGMAAGISYGRFLLHLMPVALLGMGVTILAVRWMFRAEFSCKEAVVSSDKYEYQWKRMRTGVGVFLLVVVGFFLGQVTGMEIPMVALTGGALIMLLGKARPSEVIMKVDWVLLLFFASLFIVVHAVEKTGLLSIFLLGPGLSSDASGMGMVHGLSLVLSQLVSNVPLAVLMVPLLKSVPGDVLWLSLASASTLAGNATVVGAMANLIVIGSAERQGVRIGFRTFLKIGLPVTLITLALSFIVLYLQLSAGLLRL